MRTVEYARCSCTCLLFTPFYTTPRSIRKNIFLGNCCFDKIMFVRRFDGLGCLLCKKEWNPWFPLVRNTFPYFDTLENMFIAPTMQVSHALGAKPSAESKNKRILAEVAQKPFRTVNIAFVKATTVGCFLQSCGNFSFAAGLLSSSAKSGPGNEKCVRGLYVAFAKNEWQNGGKVERHFSFIITIEKIHQNDGHRKESARTIKRDFCALFAHLNPNICDFLFSMGPAIKIMLP